MKILIVSDTHRKDDNLKRVIQENLPLDMLIHLGAVSYTHLRNWSFPMTDQACRRTVWNEFLKVFIGWMHHGPGPMREAEWDLPW